MGGRRQVSLASNPLLIGAITALVVIVAVYLSFNANSGLPFVPTYNINAKLPDADGLLKGNDVRIGGTRVGAVAAIVPFQEPDGRSVAIVEMKLEKRVGPLPADTTDTVLSRSDVGLKYMALFRGSSSAPLREGSTLPLSRFHEPVEIDEFFNMFDRRTRRASQENLLTGGDGLAERGPGLNRTIETLRPLVDNAIPVLHNLAAPQTGFGELWRDLEHPASETANVAQADASFFSDLDTFFGAWASVYRSLEAAIEGGPPALEQATRSLRYEASFVQNSTEFMRLLRPSAVALRKAAPPLASAFEAATTTFPAAVALNERLKRALAKLRGFAGNQAVLLALEQLGHTAQLGNTVVAGIAPEQATCNYITLALRNLSSMFAEDLGVGTAVRAEVILAPTGPNSEGLPSATVASGPSPEAALGGHFNPEYNGNFLHVNPYPNVSAPGQPAGLCEAGNEQYEAGKVVIGHAAKVARLKELTEVTRRENDLFGNRYPTSTLKDLGLPTSTKTGSGK